MKEQPHCQILLFGGLGNQLFQIAAGLHAANGRPLVINTSFIDRKRNKNWFDDHHEFAKIDKIFINNSRSFNWIAKRLIGLAIRSSAVKLNTGKNKIIMSTARKFLQKLLKKIVFQNSDVYIADGIGFDSQLPTESNTITLIGYFQSYKWIYSEEKIIQLMRQLTKCESKQARSSHEVLLQIRLGDFESVSGFQVVDTSYIKNALKYLSEIQEIKSIRVYSDESDRAKKLFRNWRNIELTYDESDHLDPLSTLKDMATFQNYIISSSTFGIWGAILAQESQNVVAPTPWFSKSIEPAHLLPPSWFRAER
jgi:hypothetical protein